jgi:hypothetical protein
LRALEFYEQPHCRARMKLLTAAAAALQAVARDADDLFRFQ